MFGNWELGTLIVLEYVWDGGRKDWSKGECS